MKNFDFYNSINLFLLCGISLKIFCFRNERIIFLAVLTSLFSAISSLQYLFLNAPDVAMTEVSIGACITTVFLLKAMSHMNIEHIKHFKEDKSINFFAYISFFIIFLFFFKNVSTNFPNTNSDFLPPHYNSTIRYYVDQTKDFLQFPNIVTAIIISFRGYDTLMETLVILTAGVSVMSILRTKNVCEEIKKSVLYDRSILSNMVLLIIPFIILFGLYIQAYGKESPGGGFQAGSILTSGVIALSLTVSEDLVRKYLTNKVLIKIGAFGVLTYFLVGLIPLIKEKNFLNHSYFLCNASNTIQSCFTKSQQIGILFAELGVGITIFAVMSGIFLNLRSEK